MSVESSRNNDISNTTTRDITTNIGVDSSLTTTTTDKITYDYTDTQLEDIYCFAGTLNDLKNQYSKFYVKEIDVGYRIAFFGETSVVIFVYSSDEETILSQRIFNIVNTKSSFELLSVGDTLEDVQLIAPLDEKSYIFLYTGTNIKPWQSIHCTADGYIITITYDDNYVIKKIDVDLLKQ